MTIAEFLAGLAGEVTFGHGNKPANSSSMVDVINNLNRPTKT